jgi:DNA-directed RNA polymerase sigma subunit (sigma70/sigma32)
MYRKKVRRGKYMSSVEDDADYVEASTAAESSAIAQTETTNDVNKLLSRLSPMQQTIVREMVMCDSKPRPAEISKRLGITPDRLQAELTAAMEIMRSAAESEK